MIRKDTLKHGLRTALSLLAFLTYASPAFAINCESILERTLTLQVENMPTTDARLVRHTIQKINKLIRGFEIPVIRVLPEYEGQNYLLSHYNSNGRELFFGIAHRPMRLRSLTVLAHEYGHAIFATNFKIELNGVEQRLVDQPQLVEAARQKLRENPEYIALKAQDAILRKESPSSPKLTKIVAKLSEMYFRNENQHVKPLEIPQLFDATTKSIVYSELFADLIAALHAGDGAAVADVMGIPKKAPFHVRDELGETYHKYREGGVSEFRPRDFTAAIEIEGYRPDPGRGFLYTGLDPARAYLWRTHFSKVAPHEIPKLLKVFLKATQAHLEERLASGESNSQSQNELLDPEQFNRRFIQLFEMVLATQS